MLPRTPAPKPDESPSGYLLRLSNANGFLGVSAIAALATGQAEYVPTIGWDYGLLQRLLGEVTLPDAFGYRTKKYVRGTVQIAGNVVAARHVGTYKARVCPACLDEFGYIRNHWDLKACVACDRHGTMMLKHCQECGERIMVRRRQLLLCNCGADLRIAKVDKAPADLVELMACLRRKVQGEKSVKREAKAGFPLGHLGGMDLDVFCATLVHLASVALAIEVGAGTPKTSSAKVSAALPSVARILSDWPDNFHVLCGSWVNYRLAKGVRLSCFQKCFKWLFTYLHKNLKSRRTQTSFLLREAALWALQNWTWKPVSVRGDWVGKSPLPEPEFCTTNAAATMTGLSKVQIDRLIREGLITAKRVRLDQRVMPTVLVSVDSLRALPKSRRPSLTADEPASRLGIDKRLYHQVQLADLIVPNWWATGKGAAIEDIDDFRSRLSCKAMSITSRSGKVRLLDLLKSYFGWRKKMFVIEGILDGSINSYVIGARTLGRLWVDESVRTHCKTRSRKLGSEWITVDGISKRYEIGFLEARALALHLCGGGINPPPPVEARKVDLFMSSHRPFSEITSALGSNSTVAWRRLAGHPLRRAIRRLKVGLAYPNGSPKIAFFAKTEAASDLAEAVKG